MNLVVLSERKQMNIYRYRALLPTQHTIWLKKHEPVSSCDRTSTSVSLRETPNVWAGSLNL